MNRSKLLLLFTFLFITIKVSRGQTNLVPNNGFEVYTTCPTNATTGRLNLVVPWTSPPNDGAAYYNACAPFKNVYNVPGGNSIGMFQYAHTGSAYAGMALLNANDSRNNIQVNLLDSMDVGKCYYVEFYVNLVNYSRYAINNLAANFSQTAINSTGTGSLLNLNPDIMLYGNPIINDTLNWIQIAGIYTAKGHEQYLTIGNFYDNIHTDTLFVNGLYPDYLSEYNIDDISVTEITSNYSPTIEYRDTTITKGQIVFIGTRTSGVNCKWFTNGLQIADSVPGITVSPTVTTTYTLEEHIPCSNTVRLDTIVVTVNDKVGINELKSKKVFDVMLYPNPNNGNILNIAPKGYLDVQLDIEILDVTGKQVYKGLLNVENGTSAMLLNLNMGLYSVKIINKTTSEAVIKKLVITQ